MHKCTHLSLESVVQQALSVSSSSSSAELGGRTLEAGPGGLGLELVLELGLV